MGIVSSEVATTGRVCGWCGQEHVTSPADIVPVIGTPYVACPNMPAQVAAIWTGREFVTSYGPHLARVKDEHS